MKMLHQDHLMRVPRCPNVVKCKSIMLRVGSGCGSWPVGRGGRWPVAGVLEVVVVVRCSFDGAGVGASVAVGDQQAGDAGQVFGVIQQSSSEGMSAVS